MPASNTPLKQVLVEGFFDPVTSTVTYVVYDGPNSACAIIDPVLDYDPKAGRTETTSVDRVTEFVSARGLNVEWILETHAHADHLSAAPYVKEKLGGRVAIGAAIEKVQRTFKDIFNLEEGFHVDGSQFDHLLQDGERFYIGALECEAISVPGHTPACMAFRIGDAVFVGDTLFMPDAGTARCDFPGGDARALYRSAQKLLSLPPKTRLFMCHDYPPSDRPIAYDSSVAEQRASNIHIRDGISEDEFVAMRTARDATLDMPVLMLPAIQINIRAGALPPAEGNGVAYLKIPINQL